jgi:hypothetical protein
LIEHLIQTWNYIKVKEQVSDFPSSDSRNKRAEALLEALNSAALAMQKAMTHDEIF